VRYDFAGNSLYLSYRIIIRDASGKGYEINSTDNVCGLCGQRRQCVEYAGLKGIQDQGMPLSQHSMFFRGGRAGNGSIIDTERLWFASDDSFREELTRASTQSMNIIFGIDWRNSNSTFFLLLELFQGGGTIQI
jgi:hypothetical protein